MSRAATKYGQLGLLAAVQLLAMALWFSASALVPQLTAEWGLSDAGRSWMTMSVQLGFVFGALLSALINLPDRWPASRVIALGALIGAVSNASVTFSGSAEMAIMLRFVTGASLALVYPPGMKLVASWCLKDRGFGIGLLVGAVTIGSGMPHLVAAVPMFSAEGGFPAWRTVMWVTSGQALLASVFALWFLQAGPHLTKASRFSWRNAADGLVRKAPRLANFGYFGHMWELYAMWTWVPVALLYSYELAGWSPVGARLVAFAMMLAGGAGAVLAGKWADRFGRTLTTSIALFVSGSCALVIGSFIGTPWVFSAIVLIWGFSIIADSAQFSAAVSELADSAYVGTALTVQTCVGFLLTLVSIRLVPILVSWGGWTPAFCMMAIGPVFGIWSMLRLRRLPDAARMAGGKR